MTTDISANARDGGRNWGKLALYGAIFIGIIVAYQFLPIQEWSQAFRDWIEGLGPLGWILFVLIYAIATFLLFPGAVLTIAAGLAFGLWGFPLVVVGATIGAGLGFLAARYLFRDRIEAKVENSPKLRAVDAAIAEDGWKIVALLRLSPALPFSLQNWALGVTKVGFWPYLLATFTCIMPGTLLYVWIGSLGGDAAAGAEASTGKYIFFGIGIVATLVVTILVGRKAKAKLEAHGVEDDAAA